MRRYRQRRREGAAYIRLLLPRDVVEELIDLGWLKPDAKHVEVRAGFVRLVNRALDLGLRPPAS